jgi:hypothetical protein
MYDFIGGRPVRASCVKRIQDKVAAGGIKKLRCVFECGIVDNRRFAAPGDLGEHSSLKNALSGTRVAHDHDVATF